MKIFICHENTAAGVLDGVFSGILGFAFARNIIWLSCASFLAIIAIMISRSFDSDTDYYLRADEVQQLEAAYAGEQDHDKALTIPSS